MNKIKKWTAVSALSFSLLIPGLAHAEDMKPMGSNTGSGMGMTMGMSDNTDMMMKNGKAYVPLRMLAETLGYQVMWNKDDKSITLKYSGMGMGMMDKSNNNMMKDMYTVKIMVDSTKVMVGMDTMMLDNAPTFMNNHVYVPKDFIAKYLLTPFEAKSM